jgi:hypothetical protein
MKLKLLHSEALIPDHFELHPVWVEYYVPEDVNRMVSDGFDRDEVVNELGKVNYSDEYLFPLRNHSQKSPYEFTLYKADVLVKGSIKFPGYLFSAAGEVTSVSIYNGNEWVVLNFSLFDSDEEIAITAELGVDSLFPLEVKSEFGPKFDKRFECAVELS